MGGAICHCHDDATDKGCCRDADPDEATKSPGTQWGATDDDVAAGMADCGGTQLRAVPVLQPVRRDKSLDSEGARVEALAGDWFNRNDGSAVGTIRGCVVDWDPSFHFPPTSVRFGSAGVEMELLGYHHTADFTLGPPALLRWSDGEVWERREGVLAASVC